MKNLLALIVGCVGYPLPWQSLHFLPPFCSVPGTDNSLMEAGMSAAIAGFGMVNVSTGAKSDILQKATIKVSHIPSNMLQP
jgi:hypothetical protein